MKKFVIFRMCNCGNIHCTMIHPEETKDWAKFAALSGLMFWPRCGRTR